MRDILRKIRKIVPPTAKCRGAVNTLGLLNGQNGPDFATGLIYWMRLMDCNGEICYDHTEIAKSTKAHPLPFSQLLPKPKRLTKQEWQFLKTKKIVCEP